MRKLPKDRFNAYYNALPILGQDGSLADFGKTTGAVGKVRAKPGTGIAFNLAAAVSKAVPAPPILATSPTAPGCSRHCDGERQTGCESRRSHSDLPNLHVTLSTPSSRSALPCAMRSRSAGVSDRCSRNARASDIDPYG